MSNDGRPREVELRDHPRLRRIRVGPTAEQYKRAHPEVDWTRHEVLYHILSHGADKPMVTQISGHHLTPDYDSMYDQIDGLPPGTSARMRWEDKRRDNAQGWKGGEDEYN